MSTKRLVYCETLQGTRAAYTATSVVVSPAAKALN